MLVESPGSHDPLIFDIARTRGLAVFIGYLGLCFPSCHSPFTPGLHYGPSRKTTLRPWDLVFASKHFIWTGSIYLLSTRCRQVSVLGKYRGSHIASPFSLLASGP